MKLFEYLKFVWYCGLLSICIISDILFVVVLITILLGFDFAIEFNSQLSNIGGTYKGGTYSQGAFIVFVLLSQVPIVPYAIKGIKNTDL